MRMPKPSSAHSESLPSLRIRNRTPLSLANQDGFRLNSPRSRKATLKAHPDKEGGSEEKMAQLNEAYEVLSNPGTSLRVAEDPHTLP